MYIERIRAHGARYRSTVWERGETNRNSRCDCDLTFSPPNPATNLIMLGTLLLIDF